MATTGNITLHLYADQVNQVLGQVNAHLEETSDTAQG